MNYHNKKLMNDFSSKWGNKLIYRRIEIYLWLLWWTIGKHCLGLQEVVSWVSSIRWIGQRWCVRRVVRQGSIRRCRIRRSDVWCSSVRRSCIGRDDSCCWTNKRSRCVWRNEFSGWCNYRGGDSVIDRMCVVRWCKWSDVGCWCDSGGSGCNACECNDLWEK